MKTKGLNTGARERRGHTVRSSASITAGGGPIEGERVLFCGHADLSDGIHLTGTYHWHRFIPHETVSHKETGETFECQWFAICDKCQTEFADDPADALQQHTEWIGTTPDITRVI